MLFLKNIVVAIKDALRLKKQPSLSETSFTVFEGKCAFCDSASEDFLLIEDTPVPCCIICKSKIASGIRWSTVMKANYKNENRRYSSKYLRLILWIAEEDD